MEKKEIKEIIEAIFDKWWILTLGYPVKKDPRYKGVIRDLVELWHTK